MNKESSKITMTKKNFIPSLPRELLIDIIQSSRFLNEVANERSVYHKYDFFNLSDPTALEVINQAAYGVHDGAQYMLVLMSIFSGGKTMSEGLMFNANMKKTEPVIMRKC
ncbi:hypothetical protein EJD97_006872 [Solanum chilense]|uniref:Uncharacterized protein n=1 Tax=Solanum chilense TaxID=4083 RepID=A0A6N2AQH3_SOLCI|nr:hypothetical protein EJD97_006872 [Solanum chilense]